MIQAARIGAVRRGPLGFGMLTKRRPMDDEVLRAYLAPFLADSGVRRDALKVLRGISNRQTLEAAERLRQFDRPTLIAWAPEDRFFKLRFAERLVSDIPNARLVRIEDSFTFVPEDQPERLAEEITGFIARDSGGHRGGLVEMTAKLYSLSLSHPARASRLMLEFKGIDHEVVDLLPGMHPMQLRAARFRHGTVPALKVDGKRVQGSVPISRFLERLRPQPPLFPTEPAPRRGGRGGRGLGREGAPADPAPDLPLGDGPHPRAAQVDRRAVRDPRARPRGHAQRARRAPLRAPERCERRGGPRESAGAAGDAGSG